MVVVEFIVFDPVFLCNTAAITDLNWFWNLGRCFLAGLVSAATLVRYVCHNAVSSCPRWRMVEVHSENAKKYLLFGNRTQLWNNYHFL